MNLFWWAPLICQIVAIVYLLASNLCWTSFWRARRTYFIQSRWWIWFRWARPHFWPPLMSDALVSISTSIMYTMHPFDKRNLILTSPTNLILWWARRTSFWAPLICQIAAIVYLLASNRWWTSFWRARSNLILTSPTNLSNLDDESDSDEPDLILTNSSVRRPHIYLHNVHLASNRWHRASPSLLEPCCYGFVLGGRRLSKYLSNFYVYQGT